MQVRVSEFVRLLPITSAPYGVPLHMIHILNWHNPGNALVHN